jgi:UDP-3-O-[3-hydroxymyristoyl] glucosamine N-acyltransferase
VGDPAGKSFTEARAVHEAGPKSLVWINPTRPEKQQLVEQTRAQLIVCDPEIVLSDESSRGKCLIVVERPKLAFSRILEALFVQKPERGVHPTAIVHPEAQIGEDVHLGPFSYVGRSEIGNGSTIHGHCHIYDGVTIGRRVIVHAGCVIGADGFSFERDRDGTLHKFPHIGGVVIEDDVELQALTAIDRGTLEDTVIRRGAKVGSVCHIGHNSDVGHDTMVAQSVLGGSVRVGRRCWLGPATVLRDGITIGDDVYVALGSLVVRDLASREAVMGSPARPIDEYKAILKATRALASEP